jgi:uncharacterized protein (TIGR02117 family)
MKKAFNNIWKSLKGLGYMAFTFFLLYFLFAFLLSIIPINSWKQTTEPKTETIYLLTNGIHLDFIFESADLEAFHTVLEIEAKHKYIAIGWGDKGFYLNTKTWGDLEYETLINALFLKSQAAIHLTRYQRLNNETVKIALTKTQLDIIINHAISSFEKNATNEFLKIPDAAYFNNDNFYKAKGSYNCIKTCNEWVNIGLKKAKVKTAIWSPFDKGILYQIR